MKRVVPILAAMAMLLSLCAACSGGNGNKPYEPDIPVPAPHNGVFSSNHGSLRFNGDGESVTMDLDAYLAGLTGLPEGEHSGTYAFLSGELPPNGSVPVRYDAAHELRITTEGRSAVIEMGVAAEDGSSAQAGVGTVTPERIPMLFWEDGKCFDILFCKEGGAE